MTGGLYKEELTVVAGRPSMGKSAVALWMALHQARQGTAVAYFSVEMSKEQNVMRLLSMISGVNADSLRFKGTTASDRARLEEAKKELERLRLTLEYCGCGHDRRYACQSPCLCIRKAGWEFYISII